MIILAKPSKPFTFTGKGSIRKTAVVADYADEIESTYAAVEAATSANVEAPKQWTKDSAVDFVRAVVLKVMESKVGDKDDIFQHGADRLACISSSIFVIVLTLDIQNSLQSTVIRNSIVNALKTDRIETSKIAANFVYESPTIAQLGRVVYAIIDPTSFSAADKIADKVAEIDAYIKKYSSNLPVHRPSLPAARSDVILITGSTGALGTTVLAQLVENPSVSRIYAINRKGAGKTLKQRQVEALVDRGYDAAIVSSPKVVLVETDSKLDPLGVSPALYDEVCEVEAFSHLVYSLLRAVSRCV
jgi:hypothetical protein